MSNNLVPIDINTLPTAMRARIAAGQTSNQNFAASIRDSFPTLSIKGKAFSARISGRMQQFINPNDGTAMQALSLVLVNASPLMAKTYYKNAFDEKSENKQPDCWSLDAVKPDPSVVNKVNPVCQGCPKNEFNSREHSTNETPNTGGTKGKACQDIKRIAVVMPHMIQELDPQMLLLRVPATSFKNLKNYVDYLAGFGIDINAVKTRISFDPAVAYPKLMFSYVGPLDDQQYERVVELKDSPFVKGMLSSPDFDIAASNEPEEGPVPSDDGPIPVLTGAAAPQPQQRAAPQPASTLPEGVIELPDGRLYDPVAKVYVERPEPEPDPEPQLHVVESHVIELPDGRLYDPVAKAYVERTQPKVEMPELDPNVIEMPDGKFYNTATKQYVAGPQKFAQEAPAPVETKRPRKPRQTKPKEQTGTQAYTQPQTEEVTPKLAEAAPQQEATKEAVKNGEDTHVPEAAKPAVAATPANMEAFLSKLMPPKQ
jgi:hypothetical protein